MRCFKTVEICPCQYRAHKVNFLEAWAAEEDRPHAPRDGSEMDRALQQLSSPGPAALQVLVGTSVGSWSQFLCAVERKRNSTSKITLSILQIKRNTNRLLRSINKKWEEEDWNVNWTKVVGLLHGPNSALEAPPYCCNSEGATSCSLEMSIYDTEMAQETEN